jgi:hypothetical protein
MKLEKMAINTKKILIKVESSALNNLGKVRDQFHGLVDKETAKRFISDENLSGFDNVLASKADKTSSTVEKPGSRDDKTSSTVEKPGSRDDKTSSKVEKCDGNFETRYSFDERGDVPGWVLVVLMTTGLVTAIWTIAAPRLSAILKNSLDAMNGIR